MSDEEIDGSIFDTTVTEVSPGVAKETKEDVTQQLCELQELVVEMKDAFTLAMSELSKIQYSDKLLEQKVETHQKDNQKQLADVLQMVLSLKNDLKTVTTELRSVNESQRSLQTQVETLQTEREILLEELGKFATNQENLRQKYSTPKANLNNEAQLSVLLEKAHGAFQNHISDHDSGVTNCRPGDVSSCGEATPPTSTALSPMMQTYINGLHNSQEFPDEPYDSDSSITAAANKSLDLSRTLHEKCLENDDSLSSDEHPATPTLNGATDKKGALHVESPVPPCTSISSPAQSPIVRKLAPHEHMIQDGQRLRVARELVETEKKYCSCLWTIIDFLVESVKTSGTVSARDMSTMFPPSLPSLYEFHSSLLLKMEDRLSNWKLQGILGDIFGRISDSNSEFFPLYQCYVNEFPAALEIIRKSVKHSQKFKKLVRDLQLHPACQGLDLGAYLLTPIQRPPRYVLLLKQLLKHTDHDHPDFYYLESTLSKLKGFLDQLNNSMETGVPMDQYSYTTTKRKPTRPVTNGVSQSCDGLNLSMTRDSGVHSPDDHSFMGKSFYPPKSKVKPSQYEIPSSLAQSKKMFRSARQLDDAPQQSSDTSYNGAMSMPGRKKKKKKVPQDVMDNSYSVPDPADYHAYTRRRSTPVLSNNRRVCLGQWNDDNFHRSPRLDSDSDTPSKEMNSSHSSSGLRRAHQGVLSDHSLEYDMYVDSFKHGDFSAILAQARNHHLATGHNVEPMHQSSPRDNFGIYGDTENECENSRYQTSQTETRHRAPKLGLRSKSQENILAEDRRPKSVTPEKQDSGVSGRYLKTRPKSAMSMPYINSPANQKGAWDEQRQDVSHDLSVWNDSLMNDSTSGNSTVLENSRRKEPKKKKKERQRPLDVSQISDGKSKRRVTIRDSIKQIFTRRRGSRVVELTGVSSINDSLNVSHTFPGESRNIARRTSESMDTYEDENGEPCSAV